MSTKTTDTTMTRAVGRRKEASARVRITLGTGVISINDRELKQYFPALLMQQKVLAPLVVAGKDNAFDVSVKVVGGGTTGQAEAVRHGIARALVAWNPDFKPVLRAEGFMTRDARSKERKKPGLLKARRGRQWKKR
ncbi:MAG: 30S ribosomal protein S9 [Candidatus Magasanikbacteria bacterium CG11_big_fil_rev_8_21_14_0_20_43_7]|uniref:Small ribosomal subunit protein uS9 n=1 Tax=Candidatus Magasanikbacteria bacterium CG11_big_fil_rev_8_21_14_0_20_43_7 TaxID=1974654 RepID=A0A2H0N3J7_9BACT|nr:MAG: 30S ribosomal protein S9 [Candidatus Magasanikbacteria bacterium CG11_big_fil_rev_8_21_14_0_20_43_7]